MTPIRWRAKVLTNNQRWGGTDLRPIVIFSMKHLFYISLLLLFSACAFMACGDDENDFWWAGGSSNTQPVLPASGAEQHRLEVPAMELGNDFIAHYDLSLIHI